MKLVVDIQVATVTPAGGYLPTTEQFEAWVKAALPDDRASTELTLRLVDEDESQTLNARYRDKNSPTNVLSFPSDLPAEWELPLLGDLVICRPVVEAEAQAQGKPEEAHWAHMVVHGTLHLLGYDHIEDDDAEIMEARERDILAGLGYPDPYAE